MFLFYLAVRFEIWRMPLSLCVQKAARATLITSLFSSRKYAARGVKSILETEY